MSLSLFWFSFEIDVGFVGTCKMNHSWFVGPPIMEGYFQAPAFWGGSRARNLMPDDVSAACLLTDLWQRLKGQSPASERTDRWMEKSKQDLSCSDSLLWNACLRHRLADKDKSIRCAHREHAGKMTDLKHGVEGGGVRHCLWDWQKNQSDLYSSGFYGFGDNKHFFSNPGAYT